MDVPPSEFFSQKMSVIVSVVVTCMICSDDLFFFKELVRDEERKGNKTKGRKGENRLEHCG